MSSKRLRLVLSIACTDGTCQNSIIHNLDYPKTWANYLKKWTPTRTAKWFLDSKKRLGAKMLVTEQKEMIVAVNGIISERNTGKGRFFTGKVVSPNHR